MIRDFRFMRRLKYIAAFFTGLCLICLNVLPQSDQPVLTQLTSNDGLSFNTILAIHQDSEGYMWFQTWKGLDRFDGIEFLNYRTIPERYEESGEAIAEDSLGNLWYGEFLSMYTREEDSPCRFIHPSLGEKWKPFLRNILIGPDDLLYLANFKYVMTMDPYDNAFAVDTIISPDSSYTFNRITKIRFHKDNRLWLGTDEGIYTYQSDRDTCIRLDGMSYPENSYIHDFLFDFEGSLWAVFTNELIKYDFHKQAAIHFQLPHVERAVFSKVLQTKDGTIWLGTDEKGLYYLKPGQDQFTCLLDHMDISVIYEDRSGRLWIGTENAGIILYDPLRNFFRQLPLKLENRALISSHINKVISDGNKGLWISSQTMGILYFQFETGLTSIIDAENSMSDILFCDRQGKIWYQSQEFLACYDPEDKSIFKVRHPVITQFPEWNYGNVISGIIPFHDRLIFSSDNGELYVFDPMIEDFTPILDNPAGIRAMLPEKDSLLVALYGTGVIVVDSTLTITDTIYYNNRDKGLMYHAVMAIHRDQFDSLWIGGYGGLSKLNPETQEFEYMFGFHESSGFIVSILEDRHGDLWVGSSNGIYKYDRKGGLFTLMDSNHGVPTGRFFGGSAAQTPDGVMYFGGNSGIVYFRPDEVRLNTEVPRVVITGFHLNVKARRDSPEDNQALFSRIGPQEEIRLKYWQNSFSIKYASLNYTSPQHNQYRYMLSGLEDHWNEVGNQSQAIYTDLRGGRYIFQVMGSNNDGLWNETIISIPVRIDPPPWFSWWAISLYTLLVLSAVLFIYAYNLRRIRVQHELEMKTRESESLQEIDRAKSRFFTSISHEFRTPLTLILDPAEQLYKDEDTNPRQLRFTNLIIKNAQRLLFLINQILDLAKLNSSQIKLKVEETDLVQFVRPVAQSFRSRAESLGLGYRILVPGQPVWVWIDKARIEQVLINLISNAFKFTTSGEIILEIREEIDTVCIRVKDSGMGIPEDQIEHIFDNFYQVENPITKDMAGSGVGLYLVKQLVQLHHGLVEVSSELDKGSTFTVCFLKGKDHFPPEQVVSESQPQIIANSLDLETALSAKLSVKETPGTSRPKLLIVEDNPDMTQYLGEVLSEEYSVVKAKDGEEGFRKALEMNPDVVISDVMMPVMDGYAFCEKMKKDIRTSHIPVILLTAKILHEDKISGLQLGADDYLQKPFHLDELKLRIRYHLELREKIQEEFLRNFKINTETELAVSVNDKLLQTVFSHIEEHMHDDQFGVEKLSKVAGMSRKHLNNKIKSLTKQNTNELIRSFRLRKAAYLLSEKGITVSEACYQVGFNNLSYFSKCFADLYGTRPSDYSKSGRH